MDGIKGLEREYDAENRRRRNVDEHIGAFNPTRFWQRAAGQNFIITGGQEQERCHVLAEALCEHRKKFKGPIVVLNGSEEFERYMIQLAKEGKCGRLVVCSPDYPTYNPFAGLDNLKIREMFQVAGQIRGYSADSLGNYVEAFLQVLGCRYEADIFAMMAMAELSDTEIVELGASYGVKRNFLDTLKSEKYSGEFRQVLKDFWAAFENIAAEEATAVSIANIDDSSTIYLIWSGTESVDLFSMEVARELIYLQQTMRRDLLLVVNDTFLTIDKTMKNVIVNAKGKNRFGICSFDILTGWEDAKDVIANNAPALIVMYTGLEDSENTGKILEKYGFYKHASVTKGVGAGPGPFHGLFGWTKHANVVEENKARVDMEDMSRFRIAARGDQADRVNLYRKLYEY